MKLTILFITLLSISFAQKYALLHYSIEEGLAQSTVYHLNIDNQGFLWCSSQDGISRFDGIYFENYSTNEGLQNERVLTTFHDKFNDIWVGTLSNGIYKVHKDSVFSFSYNHTLPSNNINDILFFQENYWFATDSGLMRYNEKRITIFFDSLWNNKVNSLAFSPDSSILWIATAEGLNYFKNDSIHKFHHPVLMNNHISKIFCSSIGELWIGTLEGNLYILKNNCLFNLHSFNEKNHFIITDMIEDRNNQIYISSDGGGISIYQNHSLIEKLDEKKGLKNSNILSLDTDWEGNIWIGYFGAGISCLTGRSFAYYQASDGLAGNIIFDITQDKNGCYWFANYGVGLTCLKNGKFKTFNQNDGLISTKISDIDYHQNQLWICSDRGLSVMSLNNKLKNFTAEDGLPHRSCESVTFSKFGDTAWVATRNGLVYITNNKVHLYDDPNLNNTRILKVLKTKNNDLWVGSVKKGAFKICNNKISKHLTTQDSLAQNNVFDIFEDSEQNIWFATDYGISRLDKNNRITTYRSENGLSNDITYFILEDYQKNLWIGTNYGLNKLHSDTLFTHYTVRDGLSSNEMNSGACYIDSNGILWFGTINGVTFFNPKYDNLNLTPPKIILKNVFLGNEKINDNNMVFEHKINRVLFDFIGISYKSPQSVSYQYRLKGLEDKWNFTNLNTVQYASLPAGNFLFQVKAKNKNGIESSEIASFSFTISPPFWRTPVFLFTLSMLLILLAYIRIKTVKKQKKTLEMVISERTKEISEKNLRLEAANLNLTRLSKKLDEASKTDPLTGLSNRRAVQEKIDYELVRFERTQKIFSIIMSDIDYFKKINDTYGHECGDYILKSLALLMKNNLRKMDIVSRWGGEEFLIILPETDIKGALITAEKIRKRIKYYKFNYEDTFIPVTMSFGLSAFHSGLTIEEIIKEADNNLYKAKKSGRDKVVSPSLI